MKLVTITKCEKSSINGIPLGKAGALLSSDEVLDLSLSHNLSSLAKWIPESVSSILEAGDEGLELVRRVVDKAEEADEAIRERLREQGALLPVSETRLLAPVPCPGFILAAGRNYGKHLTEMGSSKPPHPTHFVKSTAAIIGPDSPIILPAQCPDMVDFEGEFSFAFGRSCHNVDEEDAMDYVAGYTIINDVSARDWVAGAKAARERMEAVMKWELNIMGKQLPTFCPMGPALVTRDEIPDPHEIDLTTRLNGEVMQSANTNDLVFKLPEIISYFSKWYYFRPGDVITTGSPSGVGFARDPKIFMKAGDVVSITVDGVGTLSNPVIASSESPGI